MKIIIALIIATAAIIFGITTYLGPDDLAHCKNSPGSSASCQPADAVVAISGGDTSARVKEAIDLYKKGWAPLLIFSGAAQDKSGPSNAAVMRNIALGAGVPDKDIITEDEGETTRQNAENSLNIFQENDISSVILVTSGYHQRRASLEFNKRSNGLVRVQNHPVAADRQWSNLWWITPTGWYLAVGEIIRISIFYAIGTR